MVADISKIDRVRQLVFCFCKVDNASLRLLKNPHLLHVSVAGTNFDNEGAAGLAECHQLEEIKASKTRVGDDGIVRLAQLKKLRQLELGKTPVSERGIEALSHAGSLVSLELTACPNVTDSSLEALRKSKVRDLRLEDTQIGDAGLKYLFQLNTLEKIRLSGTKVTLNGLKDFFKHPKLSKVELAGVSGITAADVASLRSQYPKVEIETTRKDANF